MRKLLSKTVQIVLLAAYILSVVCVNSFAADFPDMPRTHKNFMAVDSLVDLGVIAGYDDGSFKPEREITRTEFCALMARTLGYDKNTYKADKLPFIDVPDGYWGIDYISFCFELGLVNGMGNNEFWPAAKVTVEQATKMAVCAIEKEGEAQKHKGDKWYSGYVRVAEIYDLFYKISPEFGKAAVRGDIAQLVYNMIESGLTKSYEGVTEQDPDEDEEEENLPQTDEGIADDGENGENTETVDKPESDEEESDIPPEILAAYREKDVLDIKTILIDAGHNYKGFDTGAENKGLDLKEELITWQIADKLRALLEDMGYAVVMTRENITDSIANTSVLDSLSARVELAHYSLADLYISIHCNAGGGSGTEVYCFSKNSYAGVFAGLVQKNITESTGLYDRGVKTAKYYVIQNTLMPAILIETGFIDNPKDIEIISKDKGQSLIAKAVAEAVGEYDELQPKDMKLIKDETVQEEEVQDE